MALLEAIVERLADILEAVGREIEVLSREIFRRGAGAGGPRPRLSRGAAGGGRGRGTSSRTSSASLVTLERLVAFFTAAEPAARQQGGACAAEVAGAGHAFPDRARQLPGAEGDLPSRRHARDDLDPAECDHQDLLGGGGDLPAADARRLDLRDELRGDAGAALVPRLSDGAHPDGGVGGRSPTGCSRSAAGCRGI